MFDIRLNRTFSEQKVAFKALEINSVLPKLDELRYITGLINATVVVITNWKKFKEKKYSKRKNYGQVIKNINTKDKLFKRYKKSRLHLVKGSKKNPNTIN